MKCQVELLGASLDCLGYYKCGGELIPSDGKLMEIRGELSLPLWLHELEKCGTADPEHSGRFNLVIQS